MPNGTDQTQTGEAPQHLRDNPITSQPATVAACRADYEAGAAERASSEKRDAKARH